MKRFRNTLCALAITVTISSTALAGNIGGMRTNAAGNIGGMRTNAAGNIGGMRTSASGNIGGLRTGSTIDPTGTSRRSNIGIDLLAMIGVLLESAAIMV